MELSKYVAFSATLVFINQICSIQTRSNSNKDAVLNVTPKDLYISPGSSAQANCTTSYLSPVYHIRWELQGRSGFVQKKITNTTTALIVKQAKTTDTGGYKCILESNRQGVIDSRLLQIYVQSDKADKAVNPPASMKDCQDKFQCATGIQIFCVYRCDGRRDCLYGSDEANCPDDPCLNKFRCDNDKCIDLKHVCDKDQRNHCGDWSDESDCNILLTVEPVSVTPAATDPSSDDQMTWLKTTVYTVIACTVGVVLFISIVVIAVFRIKMKRAAARRTIRAAERRRRHLEQQSGDGHGEGTGQQSSEVEPFISSPSQSQYGNMIVNISNGVQYVPNTDYSVQCPPSYSEVIAETELVPYSPPPEYSTFDRNPRNLSSPIDNCRPIVQPTAPVEGMSTSRSSYSNSNNNNNNNVNNNSSSNNNNLNPSLGSANSEDEFNVDDLERGDQGDNQRSHSISDSTSETVAMESVNAMETQPSDTAGCTSRPVQSSSQVSELGSGRLSPWRPKQLQVRDGRIVLDGENSPPDTTNQVTQTHPGDITFSSTNPQPGKPAHIQVQGGQIVLANQEEASQVSAEHSGIECSGVARGQLDVKDGQIVFKSS